MTNPKPKRTTLLTRNGRHILEGYLFILPWLVGFAVLFAWPLFYSVQISLSKITSLKSMTMSFVGLENYIRAFVLDIKFVPMFLEVISNTLINTPLTVIFSLLIAMMLNKKMRFRGLIRSAFFIPVLFGTGFIMKEIVAMNLQAKAMSVDSFVLLPRAALFYMGGGVQSTIQLFLERITVVLWKSGIQILLFLAGLQGIPSSIYESARMDSATEWEIFWKITLPMISPVILLNTVYTIIDSFTDASNPMVTYIVESGFRVSQFEYSAAMGWIYLFFVFAVIALVFVVYELSNRRKRL